MIASIIPKIALDFNFDGVLILIFIAYLIYGYLSGGHKQIRLSINLILPFVIIYYMGSTITNYLYLPLSNTFLFELISDYMDMTKNIMTMIFAYLVTYFLLFFGIFILSIYARKYLLNENMRAKLGKKNNYLGAIFSFINGYVLVYFIILPAFSMNLVSTNAFVTNFILEHPPPFSRIARTAEKAVPIKGLADKADAFQQLLSVEGIEGYYNDAIYSYQQQYVGANDSFEAVFMDEVYPELTDDAKDVIDQAYLAEFGSALSTSNFYGVSYILVQEAPSEQLIYQVMLADEEQFKDDYNENAAIVVQYQDDVENYEINLENYEYQLLYNQYLEDLDAYLVDLEAYNSLKVQALIAGTSFTTTFSQERPEMTVNEPDHYKYYDVEVPPTDPEDDMSQEVLDAFAYVEQYQDKKDITTQLRTLGKNFENHRGLLTWYIEELAEGQNLDPGQADISAVIVSFKMNYTDIIADINDKDLQDKLYLAEMSIRSYDVFTLWLECTLDHIDTIPLDDIPLASSRCPAFDETLVTSYDFANDAISIVATLFKGESVSWIISQFKYDYEAGLFDEPFADFEEVQDVLLSTKDLVDEYELYYKDIANSIEGNISMLFKIGISVMKYHLDVYDTLENTPLIAAAFNDLARFCGTPDHVDGYDVEICKPLEGSGGLLGEYMNMRYLVSEIYFKAYFMVDENNERIVYDTEKMIAFIENANQAVEDHVITREVITAMGDQFAFNIIDDTNDLTLLEQMYEEGYISIEAMRVLSDDEYDLFSDEFQARVRSLIR